MGSSLVPIMLIVVLLVALAIFVVLNNRPVRQGSQRNGRGLNHQRHRSGTVPVRDTPGTEDPGVPDEPERAEDIVPGFDEPEPVTTQAPLAAAADGPDTGAAWGGDVTAKVPADRGDRDRDPDATGWTPPPATPPHQVPVYEDERENATRYFDPQTGDFAIVPPVPATPPAPAAAATFVSAAPAPQAPPMAAPGGSREHAADLVATEPEQTTAAPLRLAAAGRTRRGKRGGPNEDAFVVVDGLLAVSDGVGGEAAGQIASTLTVTTVAGFRPQYAEDPMEGLRRAVERANRVVRTRAREEPTWLGMACTLDVVILGRQQNTGEHLTIAHVGDSSVWLQPGRGRPRALTTPHAIRNGPLLNAVGLADEIEADIFAEPVRAGDRVVLASDGITKVMTPEQLDGLLGELGSEPPERAADALVEAALLAGARDDTTIVVGDLVSEPATR
ncbi:conserved hypothetical protein [Frankia canadensis]|uniref:PPM-type phosphatase domain-containing protein n=1 Tax=Frankia canadensis TaxID=1836972 RepID=A0A2I2L2C8_9ACTN|nr:PP2C family serine/threonine-protein phosphatase [Frankia canadensis]SNQ52083.1 conserved hypothetical protein [Frankia canadensis]SOU59373.1 conserved hypothetical protein [Frankia canadensis]